MSLLDGFFALGDRTNTVQETESGELELLPELTLEMDDEELISLKNEWTKKWDEVKEQIEKQQNENERYWLGKHFSHTDGDRTLTDNLIFESLETFLPIATRPKAEPLVESDGSEEGKALEDTVRKMLAYQADIQSYNLELKQVARYWALYMLGIMKIGWSAKENDLTCVAIRPQKLILDPEGTISKGEYTGYYIGEKLEDTASDLIIRFPKQSKMIKDKVKGKMGTKVPYIMWTTDEYIFWTHEDEVLDKTKNPHWNYETTVPAATDEFGVEGEPTVQQGLNHFKTPRKPYVFLSIFNLGKRPFDDTNLVQQNLPLQDLVNKRLAQIDKNADNANGGLIVSGDAFTEEQASKAAKALRKGGVVWVPSGDVNTAVRRDAGAAMPQFVYESLLDYRDEIRNIFGTRGSTPQGTIGEDTVGGKQIIRGQDTDRIGGGVSTYLEQFSDNVFNWWVQLMYVYYDEPHSATILGAERAQEYITLKNTDFGAKLLIGVKEGSMIPHDPASERGEAMELWTAGGIDPITFFDRLEFPNPRESAKNLYLWMSDPVSLFPDLQEQQMRQQQQMQAQEQEAQGQEQANKQQEQAVEAQAKDTEQIHKLQQIALSAATATKTNPNGKEQQTEG